MVLDFAMAEDELFTELLMSQMVFLYAVTKHTMMFLYSGCKLGAFILVGLSVVEKKMRKQQHKERVLVE